MRNVIFEPLDSENDYRRLANKLISEARSLPDYLATGSTQLAIARYLSAEDYPTSYTAVVIGKTAPVNYKKGLLWLCVEDFLDEDLSGTFRICTTNPPLGASWLPLFDVSRIYSPLAYLRSHDVTVADAVAQANIIPGAVTSRIVERSFTFTDIGSHSLATIQPTEYIDQISIHVDIPFVGVTAMLGTSPALNNILTANDFFLGESNQYIIDNPGRYATATDLILTLTPVVPSAGRLTITLFILNS